MTDNVSYRIRRFYKQGESVLVPGMKGLTLEQAQSYCRDPETSSRTCTHEDGKNRTARYGEWFDGYEVDPTT